TAVVPPAVRRLPSWSSSSSRPVKLGLRGGMLPQTGGGSSACRLWNTGAPLWYSNGTACGRTVSVASRRTGWAPGSGYGEIAVAVEAGDSFGRSARWAVSGMLSLAVFVGGAELLIDSELAAMTRSCFVA